MHKWDWRPEMAEEGLTLWAVELKPVTHECVSYIGCQPTCTMYGSSMRLYYGDPGNEETRGPWQGYVPARTPPEAIQAAVEDIEEFKRVMREAIPMMYTYPQQFR